MRLAGFALLTVKRLCWQNTEARLNPATSPPIATPFFLRIYNQKEG